MIKNAHIIVCTDRLLLSQAQLGRLNLRLLVYFEFSYLIRWVELEFIGLHKQESVDRLLLRFKAKLSHTFIIEKHVDSHINYFMNGCNLLENLKLLHKVGVRSAIFLLLIRRINLDHADVFLHYFLDFLILIYFVLLLVVLCLLIVL